MNAPEYSKIQQESKKQPNEELRQKSTNLFSLRLPKKYLRKAPLTFKKSESPFSTYGNAEQPDAIETKTERC